MKVFLITEGGEHIGLGHITRCSSLYQAFEEKGIAAELLINGDADIEAFIECKRYRLFDWLADRDRLFGIIDGSNIIIVDSYLADKSLLEKISDVARIPVYIDDNKRLDYPRGIVVNIGVYADGLNYPERENVVYFTGLKYATVRKEFWHVQDRKVRKTLSSVMLTFGGNDASDVTTKVLTFLKGEYPMIRRVVVIGMGFHTLNKVELLRDENTEIIYHPDATGMKEVMINSDVAISAGGQTLYELAATGTPTIGICVADNQEFNLRGWENIGFIKNAGWYDDNRFFERLRKHIDRLADYSDRKGRSDIGRRCVDGQGSRRLVDIIVGATTNAAN